VSLSGGLDSTILLYKIVKEYGKDNVYALSFDYSQRHAIELTQAKKSVKKLGVYHKVIDIGFLGDIVSGVSAMVKGNIPTPTMGDLEDQKDVSTYVPFRNMILSSIVLSFAESVGANKVALGVQYGDYASKDEEGNSIYHYWDCSEDFTKSIQAVMDLNDKHSIEYLTPFVKLTKSDEIKLALELGVPLEDTWTCYAGNVDKVEQVGADTNTHYQPCSTCPSCVGRMSAFEENRIEDPVMRDGVWSFREH